MNNQIVTVDYFKLGKQTAEKYKRDYFKKEQLIERLSYQTSLENLHNKMDNATKNQFESLILVLTESAETNRQLTMLAIKENIKTTASITNTITLGNRQMTRQIYESTNKMTDTMEKTTFENIKAYWLNSYDMQKLDLEIFKSSQTIAEEQTEQLQKAWVEYKEQIIARYNELTEHMDEQVAQLNENIEGVNKNVKKVRDALKKMQGEFTLLFDNVYETLEEHEATTTENADLLQNTRNALSSTNAGLTLTGVGAPGAALSQSALWFGYGFNKLGRAYRLYNKGKYGQIAEEAFGLIVDAGIGYASDALGKTNFGKGVGKMYDKHVGRIAAKALPGLKIAKPKITLKQAEGAVRGAHHAAAVILKRKVVKKGVNMAYEAQNAAQRARYNSSEVNKRHTERVEKAQLEDVQKFEAAKKKNHFGLF